MKIKWKAVKWLLVLLAVIAYLVIGGVLPYIKNPKVSDEYKEEYSKTDFYGQGTGTDRTRIITDNGEALEERLRLIEHARERIVLSTFSFCADTSGKQMLAALKAAAERGVSVRILVDGFNSWLNMEGNPYFIDLARHKNVQIKIYNKVNPLLPWKAMSRLHDKYIVADETVYLLGGRNTFDFFLGDQESYKNYDCDVLVYNSGGGEGSVREVLSYFEEIWGLPCSRLWHENDLLGGLQPSVKRAGQELTQIYASMKDEHPEWFARVDYEPVTVSTRKVSLLSGQTRLYAKEPRVLYGLCRLMEHAEEDVTIHTPYIMCDEWMYQELTRVCSGEAAVTLMTNSPANNGNPFGAVDYVLHKEKILDTGLVVLEYDGDRSYHTKCIAIDDNISIVGSFNMDMKSAYQDTELMLVIDSEECNEQLRGAMEHYQQSAHPAVLSGTEMESLFAKDVPVKTRLQRWVIKLLDPFLRFLL